MSANYLEVAVRSNFPPPHQPALQVCVETISFSLLSSMFLLFEGCLCTWIISRVWERLENEEKLFCCFLLLQQFDGNLSLTVNVADFQAFI